MLKAASCGTSGCPPVFCNAYSRVECMWHSSSRCAPFILLIGYLLGASAVELLHQDAFNLLLNSHPVVSSHDCGAHERHLPSDHAKHCLACSPMATRIAVLSSPILLPALAAPQSDSLFATGSHPITSCYYYSFGKRGPPKA